MGWLGTKFTGVGSSRGPSWGLRRPQEAQNRGFGVGPGGWGPPGPPCRPALFSRFGILTYRPDRAMLLGTYLVKGKIGSLDALGLREFV